jgi:amidase
MNSKNNNHHFGARMLKDYANYDALGLAQLIKDKEISATELLDTAIARAEQENPAINAIITKLYDFGHQQIKQGLPEGPFLGVPFLLKDWLTPLEGTPLSNGSAALKGNISPSDSEMVKRYKSSGLVIFGKTNTPEFGLMGVTEPKAFGPSRNPWNLNHTPGGSSGGSSAAIAAGIVPMASASDGGGSIRIPAACCGLFGLKPSRGRTATGPYFSDIWDGAAAEHVLTRSVRDSAAMLDIVAGPDGSSPYPVRKETGYLACLEKPVRPLKIAYTVQSFFDRPVTEDAIQSVQHTVKLLESLGHTVDAVHPYINADDLLNSYLTMYYGHVAADLEFVAKLLNSNFSNLDVEDTTKLMGYIGKKISAEQFITAKRHWNEFSQSMHALHQEYDLLLTPTLGSEPVPIGEFDLGLLDKIGTKVVNAFGLQKMLLKLGMTKKSALENLEKLPFTQLANLTGQPAMSVPLYWTQSGLPLGSQFIAPLGDEKTLFQLAHQLEQAQPWFNRTPANDNSAKEKASS